MLQCGLCMYMLQCRCGTLPWVPLCLCLRCSVPLCLWLLHRCTVAPLVAMRLLWTPVASVPLSLCASWLMLPCASASLCLSCPCGLCTSLASLPLWPRWLMYFSVSVCLFASASVASWPLWPLCLLRLLLFLILLRRFLLLL